MAQSSKAENTAVNRLIELAQTKPLDDGGFDDLFVDATARAARDAAKRAAAVPAAAPAKPAIPPPFRPSGAMPAAKLVPNAPPPAPMPPSRVPSSTRTNLHAAPPMPVRRQPDDIPTKPFDAVDDIEVEIAPVQVVTQVVAPLPRPTPPLPLPPLPPASADEESWFEASRAVDRIDDFNATDDVPRIRRRSGGAVWLFIAAAFALGLAVAALLFWPGDGKAPAAKPAAAQAQPAPTPAPVVQPIPAAAVAPEPAPVAAVQELAPAQPEVAPLPEPTPAPAVASTNVTLTFESSPPGATVMLVDGSEMIPLGPAPVDYAVAPGKRYEAMFSLPGHASTIVPVDPSLGIRVAATLTSVGGSAEAAVAVAPEPEPAVAEPIAAKAEPSVAAKRNDRKAKPAKPAKPAPKREAKAEAPSGSKGVLMLAAKPPCDIVIDGKKTGLVTPQRSIDLPAGKHSITLINREHGIKESFSVTVKPGSSVKVVKDLTKRMK